MKILSLFDGMACGMLAMQGAGIKVDRYVAFEIDKYAVQTSSHNFPMIEHRGDVFQADFTEFRGFDFLVGGSPCTYWSIAQKNNRETEASGMGWELFSQYVRALHEAQPEYFIYENNKSMSNAIRESITQTFGFEPICINSALVSAQNRQRLYWVGKRNPDGTYSKVHVDQPEDRGILLRDVLESAVVWREKALCIDVSYYKGGNLSSFTKQSGQRFMAAELVAEPFGETNGKAYALTASYWKGQPKERILEKSQRTHVAEPVAINTTVEGDKARTLMAGYYKYGTATLITNDGFTGGTTAVAEPVNTTEQGKSQTLKAQYCKNSVSNFCCYSSTYGASGVAEPICSGAGDKTGLYVTPCEFDENGRVVKAISAADGKVYTVYEVSDGEITIKDKRYPIKLVDGLYIIRKLTVTECKRLQTVPEWYEFPVSDSQAYKLLGNGWTVVVITHLIKAILRECT